MIVTLTLTLPLVPGVGVDVIPIGPVTLQTTTTCQVEASMAVWLTVHASPAGGFDDCDAGYAVVGVACEVAVVAEGLRVAIAAEG